MRAQAFHATSDSRIKIKIDSAISDSSIPTLLAIKPTLFGYKDWLSSGTKLTLGFIAQEIEEVLPSGCILFNECNPRYSANWQKHCI